MESLIGHSLGRYRVVTLLGEGGMGAVFKGHDATLQREVAIKVLHPLLARDPGLADPSLQEARPETNLIHPEIVQSHNFEQANGRQPFTINKPTEAIRHHTQTSPARPARPREVGWPRLDQPEWEARKV